MFESFQFDDEGEVIARVLSKTPVQYAEGKGISAPLEKDASKRLEVFKEPHKLDRATGKIVKASVLEGKQ